MLNDKNNELCFIFLKPILFEMNRLNLLLQIINPLFLNVSYDKDPLKTIIKCVDNRLSFL